MAVLERAWLPPGVAEAAEASEAQLFHRLVDGLQRQWNHTGACSDTDRVLATFPWISMFANFAYVCHKEDIQPADADLAVSTMLEILLSPAACLATRSRWGKELARVLRTMRYKISVIIPWRPLYEVLRSSYLGPRESYEGIMVMENLRSEWAKLIHRARRFFAPGAAQEIWEQFGPCIKNIYKPDAAEALGWVVMLMPTQQAGSLDGEWDLWVPVWLDLWESVTHNSVWNTLFLGLFARLAKHDTRGAVNWAPHLDRLSTHVLAAFEVPVGTASASSPVHRTPPNSVTFMSELRHMTAFGAKLLVYLLARQSPGVPDPTLAHIASLANLMEQYYHPSNNGSWTASLSDFLQRLMKHFGKRLVAEKRPRGEDGESTPAARPVVGSAVATPRGTIQAETQRTVVAIVLQLANKAMYSKDTNMLNNAGWALAQLAYIEPDMVLRLVVERFQGALEMVTAAHQLVSAIYAMGLCSRPLLLAGLPPDPSLGEEGGGLSREAAARVLATAMMEMLPAIDVNDSSKTLVAMRFYAAVLSSVASLEGGSGGLPMFTEEWMDMLLARVFGILSNLEAPEGQQQQAGEGSFLLHGKSMFRPMVELLFGMLPPDLRKVAIRHVARFVLGNMLPTVHHEASLLCNAAAWSDPATAARELVEPLLLKVESDMASLAALSTSSTTASEPSKAQEANLKWRMALLTTTLFRMGPNILPFRARLIKLLDQAFATPYKVPQKLASRLVASLLSGLLEFFPTDQFAAWAAAPQGHESGEAVLAPWLDSREPSSVNICPAPKWHVALPEEVAFANQLVELHLGSGLQQLHAFCKDRSLPQGARDEKEGLRVILLRILGVFEGARASFPDFTPCPGAQQDGPDSLRIVGHMGPHVGSAALRDQTAAALMAAVPCTQDPESLIMIIKAMNEILSQGGQEYEEAMNSLTAWRSDQDTVHEPPVASLLYPQDGAKGWRRRRPRWLLVERVYILNTWRTSQNVYRPTASASSPMPTLATTPQAIKDLASKLAGLCLHSYEGVRDIAQAALEGCLKRYSCLGPVVLPSMLCALAGVPTPPAGAPSDAYDAAGITPSLLQVLLQAGRQACLGAGGPKLPLTAAETAAEEARVCGALKALKAHTLWRLRCRQPSAAAAMQAALLSSLANTSTKASTASLDAFQTDGLKLIRPSPMLYSQVKTSGYPPAIRAVLDELLDLEDVQLGQAHLNWRNAMYVNSTLVSLFPPLDATTARRMAGQATRMLCQQLPGQRLFGMILLKNLLEEDKHATWRGEDARNAMEDAVKGVLDSTPDFGRDLMLQMAHSHPLNTDAVRGLLAKLKGMTPEERLAEMVARSIGVQSEFLAGRPVPEAVRDAAFIYRHAMIISVLVKAAPKEMLRMLRPVLAEALEGTQQDEDRPKTYAAVEIISGLLHSGVVFEPLDGETSSAWQEWLHAMLQASLLAAPFDLAEVWAVSMRYALYGLGVKDSPHIASLLNVIAEPLPQGVPSSAQIKRLKLVRQALAELSAMGLTGCLAHPTSPIAKAGRTFQRKILAELPPLMSVPADAVREQAAIVSVLLLGSLLWEGPHGGAGLGTPLKAHPISEDDFSTLDSDTNSGGSSPMEVETGDPDALLVLAGGGKTLCQAAQDFQASIVPAMEEGVAAALSGQTGMDAGEADGPRPHNPAIAQLAFALHIVRQAVDTENGLALPAMHATLLRLLPAMLKVQEMTEPGLQPLAHEAKAATILLKYVPVQKSMLPSVITALQEAASFNLWATRGAALTFLQYFWFRHSYLLGPEESRALQELVVAGLADPKAEVQEVAATTLSGLLKGLPRADADKLRLDLLNQHAQLFPVRCRRKPVAKAGTPSEADTNAKHAVVMGLKACVLSAPYDIPSWLPEVLVAVVRSASEPPPVRNTARKAVAEFRRTHEEAELAEARNLLSQEQWEALLDVVSPASYFA